MAQTGRTKPSAAPGREQRAYSLARLGAPARALLAHKQVRVLGLESPAGFEALLELSQGAKLLIEERPPMGYLARDPLFMRLREHHPLLRVTCLSLFGLDGSHAQHAPDPLNSDQARAMAQQLSADPLKPQDRERPPLQVGGLRGQAEAGTLATVGAPRLFQWDQREFKGGIGKPRAVFLESPDDPE